jgi:hypothetical protein
MDNANTSIESEPVKRKPVVGFVSDASSWNKVTAPLRELGLRVRAAQIPLTSLTDDVAALDRLLGQGRCCWPPTPMSAQ